MNIYKRHFRLIFTYFICLSFFHYEIASIELNSLNEQNSIEELNEKVNSTYIKDVISNIKSLIGAYVFSDICKAPPDVNYFGKVDIEAEIDKIGTNDRPYYEFYRDVRRTLNKLKDFHLDIVGKDISFGKGVIEFSKYTLCLPFKLHLDYESNEDIKMYISEFPNCMSFYEKDIQEFIKSHENIALTKIEGKDAFEFVQQFGSEFLELKNRHSHFSFYLKNFHSFYLKHIPITQDEINSIHLTFENNDSLSLNYHLIKTNNLFTEEEKSLINKEEFNIYYDNEIKKSPYMNIFDIKNNFLKSKNLYNKFGTQVNDELIQWNYQSTNGQFKCRVDEKNQLNVFVQNSFVFDEEVIYNCARLFYSNSYRIVGIEDNNLGGDGKLRYLLTQLIQPKIDARFHMAVRQNNLVKEYFNREKNGILDINTCLPYESWQDFIESKADEYSEGIQHLRSKIYNYAPRYLINKVKKVRLEMEQLGKLKKPTDIIIFTDSVSYSATSHFIKNLQDTGGAIIVGYLGNPKISDIFDSSLSASSGYSYSWSSYYTKLLEYGFEANSITTIESFDGNYQKEEPLIPREYKINKVDERTNIYHFFEDSSYEEFMNEAKNIFKKYNEDNKCNKDNSKLLLENEKCDHGGFKCGNDGKWTTDCQTFYCDIGYYYNQNTFSCEIDNCSTDIFIDLNKEMEKEFEILPNTSYIISLNNDSLAYFIESPVDDIIHLPTLEVCPKFCAIKNTSIKYMYVNYHHKLSQKIIIKVKTVVNSALISSVKIDSPRISEIKPINNKIINIIQVTEENYFYADSYDNYAKIYFGEYTDGIQIKDILNTNSDFFPESHNQLYVLEPGKIYIITYNAKASYIKMYLYNEVPQHLSVSNGNIVLLYLEMNKEYEIDFYQNTMPVLVKLNPLKNSGFRISNGQTQKTLDIENKYFNPSEINEIFSGKLIINNIQTSDALIELLYSFDEKEIEILKDKSIKDREVSKKVSLIEYSDEYEEKNMEIYIKSDDPFKLAVYAGPTKDNYFYYSLSNLPQNAQSSVKNYFIKLNKPLKEIDKLEENEKYKVSLMFSKTKENQKIYISYYYNNNPIYNLYENLDKSYIDDVVSNLVSIISAYAYTEIAQNPPQPDGLPKYNHEPIDLIGSLNNIQREGRQFYDFYREMREILGTVRDLHFRIFGLNTPSGIKLDQITACLPFTFYVDKNSDGEPTMYIKYFDDCAPYFTEEERLYIKEKSDNKIGLKYINNANPFDYIQEWGRKYRGNKSPHAHFTLMKTLIHSFYIRLYPYTPDELKMSFEFESNESQTDKIELDYYIFIPNVQNMKLYHNFDNFNKNEFDNFFENELKRNKDNVLEPNIFEMIHKFKVLKGIIKETPKSTVIEWKYQTPEENGIRCRVDDENKINIFVQESFSIDDEKAQEVMYNCTRDFYQNDYRIIGIQNRDGGGWAHLCLIFHQLVQVKIQDRAFKASKLTDFFKRHVLDDYEGYVDVNTCKPFNNIDELFNGITDDFSSEEKTLLHQRSQVFNYIDKDTRKRLQNIRKEFENYGHLKKPTDIIIYTDSFSYSATSSFIKGFQYTGGAIVVGYNGNPFIGKEEFDGSQSPASVTAFDYSDEYKNLNKLGIVVSGITFAETYDDYYIKENPIPREYLLDPVDERVDIYGPYSDDNYQLFIDKAQEIFKRYNDDEKHCNPNNKKLMLDPNDGVTCYNFEDDKYAHGGYLCGDNGIWTKTCAKYYCDIGYNYNQYKGKCERDICANDPGEEDIYLNGEYNNNIILNNDNNMEYIFHINNSDYIYFFESDKGNGYIHYGYNYSCPNLCVVQHNGEFHYNKVYLNYYRNATEQNVFIKISSIKNFQGKIFSIKTVDQQLNTISPVLIPKTIYILESFHDYLLLTKTIDNSISLKLAEYNKEMTKSDILDVKGQYFKNLSKPINELRRDTIYILAVLTEIYNKPLQMLLQPKYLSENIEIESDRINFLYLTNKVDYYILDFSNNGVQRHIELSRLTNDSEIIIIDFETGEEVKLNYDNYYYTFNEINTVFKGKIAIKVTSQQNAIIEFIFKYNENDAEILTEREYINHKLSKKLNIIKFDKNYKNISLNIFSNNNKPFKLAMVSGYSKGPYYHYSTNNQPKKLVYKYNQYELFINNPIIPLENDESLYLALIFNEQEIADDFYYISLTKLDKYSIDDFNVDISEEKCQTAIKYIKQLVEEGYIYNEIIKNPPLPEYFGKVDLISDLNNVETKNRKYYDFFRDIRRIIGKMKDGHFNIVATNSPNGYDLKKMTMCLPFSFIIKGDSNDNAKVYIKKYEDCFKFFSFEVQNFIESHLDIPLTKINNTDPFDFIQNIQIEFNAIHNQHGQFTRNINSAHRISINRNPLTKEQFSNIEFVFENDLIKLDYYLYYINPELQKNVEFMDFYNYEIKKELNTLDEISILDIENKFYRIKNKINKVKDNNEIEWEYSTTDPDGLKCRVDKENKVNVFIQTTFNFIDEEYDQALDVINKCTEAFYSNDYPIIGIESNNGGGIIEVSLYLQQFLQVKIVQRTHFSTKVSDLMKGELENELDDIIDIETCKKFEKFDDMKEIVDDYGEGVTHHRTKIFELFNSTILKEHNKRREDYFKNYKLKKPTEIIIFTDSFSYSSTSFFIKGLQETGGAILVGYKGNPKSNEFFEASHSPSAVNTFAGTDIYNNLTSCGLEIIGTTFFESYNYSYQEKNPTPREYLVHPVDERVNIYQNYDDSLYGKFIEEAKKIFTKYNENQECNPNNLKLLYDPNDKDKCYTFNEDSHAHGGYECDPITKKWSNKCVPYYCDIGYYFDVYQNKCIEDLCTKGDKDSKEDDKKKFPVWAIVFLSILGFLILLAIILYCIYKLQCIKIKRESQHKEPLMDPNSKSFENDLGEKEE